MLTRNLRGLLLYVVGVSFVCLMIEVKRRTDNDYYAINKENCYETFGIFGLIN